MKMGNDSIISNKYNDIILDEIGDITINLTDTVTTGSTMYATNSFWIGNSSPTISTITLTDTIGNDTIDWKTTWFEEPKEFVDTMPPMSTIKEMCEVYPGFKKAFDHFKDIYDLVKDDYEARKNSDG